MSRKAAIYIRTSSKSQGERASPREQEADCRSLAQEKELTVVRVYRDIEKYRIKKKLVEPSGLRTNRPGLLAMIDDAFREPFPLKAAPRLEKSGGGMIYEKNTHSRTRSFL